MNPYNKVTIIIENDEKIVTLRIPVVDEDLKIESSAVLVDELFPTKRFGLQYQPDIMDLAINMRAYRDKENGHLYVMETVTKEPKLPEAH